jgi:FAD/FMN-containing dehydrogenase
MLRNSYKNKKARLLNEFSKLKKGHRVSINKKTSNLFRHRKNIKKQKLNVKDFNKVISIDKKNLVAELEGMTTYETLVKETLKHELVPTVAPELKSITVGGAISGIGVESSCFKYGFVHETVLEMDILTGTGEIVTCSTKKNKDLFYAIPNSYGTLGYVLRVKIMLVPAKKYVKIIRKKYSDYKKYVDDIKKYSVDARRNGTYDYIDGIIFKSDEMYLHLAKFVNKAPFVSDYTYMKIFYKSMHKKVDYLTTKNYIFRYDTDWFWSTRSMGLQNPVLRFLFGKRNLRSDVYYKILSWENKHQYVTKLKSLFGKNYEVFIQDAEVPYKYAAEFLSWFHKNITDARPLTIGVVIPYDKNAHFPLFPMNPNEIYFNIGYYASVPTTKKHGYYNRLFEKKLMSINAKKMMYSRSLYTKKEFWKIFNKKAYYKIKKKYDPDGAFPDLYDKCVKRV